MSLTIKSKDNTEYVFQIYPSGGQVHVEIFYRDLKKSEDKYYCIIHRSFGCFFRSWPSKSDYIRARKFVNDQHRLIKENCTVFIKEPKFLDSKFIDNEK